MKLLLFVVVEEEWLFCCLSWIAVWWWLNVNARKSRFVLTALKFSWIPQVRGDDGVCNGDELIRAAHLTLPVACPCLRRGLTQPCPFRPVPAATLTSRRRVYVILYYPTCVRFNVTIRCFHSWDFWIKKKKNKTQIARTIQTYLNQIHEQY